MARLVLICGLPGAGKTTTARALTASDAAVRLCPDEWMADLGVDLYDEPTRERLEQRFWLLAQELLRLDASVVLESGFWLRSDRDEKRRGAQGLGAAVELWWLDVPIEERWRRIQRRNGQGKHGSVPIQRDQLLAWESSFERPDEDELALFDAVRVITE